MAPGMNCILSKVVDGHESPLNASTESQSSIKSGWAHKCYLMSQGRYVNPTDLSKMFKGLLVLGRDLKME